LSYVTGDAALDENRCGCSDRRAFLRSDIGELESEKLISECPLVNPDSFLSLSASLLILISASNGRFNLRSARFLLVCP
jgi:hypothetical protein